MNIVKLQNELKNVPDQALIGYVQNPTGQVPSYLALSELQRRKEMRQNYQANKPEDKTVAEELVQETEPGISALPAGQPMQQAMEQRDWEKKQLEFYNAMLRGTPGLAQTQVQYAPTPSALSQVGGLGLGALGLAKAFG